MMRAAEYFRKVRTKQFRVDLINLSSPKMLNQSKHSAKDLSHDNDSQETLSSHANVCLVSKRFRACLNEVITNGAAPHVR